ncbi:MAG: class IV adenylate cyclase, partial [Candidatus Helarchaeota archaeon]
MFEVEIKAKIDDYTEMKKKFEKMGIIQKKIVTIEDTYFKHPKRDFSKTDEALRIRKTNEKRYLTYKGPKLDNTTKTREEIEIEVEEIKNLEKILIKLGFKKVPKIKK